MAKVGGDVQRGFVLFVGDVDVRVAGEEIVDHLGVAATCRQIDRCPTEPILEDKDEFSES